MKKRRRGRGCLVTVILLAILAYGLFQVKGESFTSITDFIKNDVFAIFDKPPVTLDNEIKSEHAVLINLKTGKVICKKSCDTKTYPASLTKIMTAILAIENIPDLNDKIAVPENIYNTLQSEDASMAGFLPNENVKAMDLLYGTMLPSGAEAAESLAIHVSGSEDKFVQLMNGKAKELGMTNTHFTNAIGLHNSDHYTTANDLAKLLRYALKNDTFKEIFTSSKYSTSETDKHPNGITFSSTMFKSMSTAEFTGGDIIGGKTGYTDEAGLCLASLAEKSGKDYILITTGAPGNHETEQYDITDALYIYNNYLP